MLPAVPHQKSGFEPRVTLSSAFPPLSLIFLVCSLPFLVTMLLKTEKVVSDTHESRVSPFFVTRDPSLKPTGAVTNDY